MNIKHQRGGEGGKPESPAPPSALSEKQRRELWLYIAVSLVAVELLIGVGALLYGFIGGEGEAGQAFSFSFPWLYFAVAAVLAPALILLLTHLADVGLFRVPAGASSEAEWQKLLPERMQKLYRIIRGAPAALVLLGVIAAGAGLLTLDGAFSAIARFASSLTPYLPYIIGGIAGFASISVLALVWLHYRTRRLIAEYEYRREVLEKTGVIIVDKGSAALPPGGAGETPYALVAGEDANRLPHPALPAGAEICNPRFP